MRVRITSFGFQPVIPLIEDLIFVFAKRVRSGSFGAAFTAGKHFRISA